MTMTYEQRQQHRELYQQLRLAITFPGDTFAGEYRKPFTAVCKDDWTWEMAMASEDTPDIAALRLDGKLSWLLLGKHRQAVA